MVEPKRDSNLRATILEGVMDPEPIPLVIPRPDAPTGRTVSDCIALLPDDSTATVDPDFGRDVAAAVMSHPESLVPPEYVDV